MTTSHARSAPRPGFTLIELMLVVSIIGILAAVGVPAYQDYTRKAVVAEAFPLASEAQRAVAAYYDRWGRLPANNATAGLAPPPHYRGRAVRAVTVDRGMVVVDLDILAGQQAAAPLTRLYLRPGILRARPQAPLVWDCGGQRGLDEAFEFVGEAGADSLDPRYRPGQCR